MTTFEKSVAVLISTVAFVIIVANLVISSMNLMQVMHLQQANNNVPRITRDKHGNLEIEIPQEFEEPAIPSYKRPGNLGEKK